MAHKKINITPSLVSFSGKNRDQARHLENRFVELRRLGLAEISLFVTTADKKARQYIQAELKTTAVKSIPHIHIRNDMAEAEAMYYFENYNSRRFTTHYEYIPVFRGWNKAIRKHIGIENNEDMKDLKGIELFGGLVIDLSHYIEHRVFNPRQAALTEKALDNFPVLVNHASAITRYGHTKHFASSIRQYDYLKDIPKRCFADVMSLEIGNSFIMQDAIIKHVKKIL